MVVNRMKMINAIIEGNRHESLIQGTTYQENDVRTVGIKIPMRQLGLQDDFGILGEKFSNLLSRFLRIEFSSANTRIRVLTLKNMYSLKQSKKFEFNKSPHVGSKILTLQVETSLVTASKLSI